MSPNKDDDGEKDMLLSELSDTNPKRVVIIGAGFGSGHNYAAWEIQSRLRNAGADVQFYDFLDGLPRTLGRTVRALYGPIVNYFPAFFELIMHSFDTRPGCDTVIRHVNRISGKSLLEWTKDADVVIATHGLATQSLCTLKENGLLKAPVASYLCDAGGHKLLFHRSARLNLAPITAAVDECNRYGYDASMVGPMVKPEFSVPVSSEECESLCCELGLEKQGERILVCAGSLGLGSIKTTVKDVLSVMSSATVIVLCGKNEKLRKKLSKNPRVLALGWRKDVRNLLAISDVMVHNAGGLAVWEAIVANVPVVTYKPLPGHGKVNARVLAAGGISPWPQSRESLKMELSDAVRNPKSHFPETQDDVRDLILGLISRQGE